MKLKKYKEVLGCKNITAIPAVVPWKEIKSEEGMGNFCLFHGNLSMPENEKAAIWLLEKVFNNLQVPFVLAGKSPSSTLQNKALLKANTCLVANPSENEMQDLITKAHINVLPWFHAESCNIKLLNALFCGRHCIVNQAPDEPELISMLYIAKNAESFKSIILRLMNEPFKASDLTIRAALLHSHSNNAHNLEKLMQLIW